MNPTSKDLGSTPKLTPLPELNDMRPEVKMDSPSTSLSTPEASTTSQSAPEVKINIPSTSHSTPFSPYLPRADLLAGPRETYIKFGVPLYEASINCDWQAAKAILDDRPELIRSAITENYEMALHVAASVEDTKLGVEFVDNLVNLMEKKDLELQNKNYNTALCMAAAAGRVKMAKIIVRKNKALLEIPGSQGMMPLYMAVLFGKYDMARYLYDNSRMMTGDFWTDHNRGWVVSKCVEADMFDLAIRIVTDRPELTNKRSILEQVLLLLARKPDAFNRIEPNTIWRIINSIFAIAHLKVGPVEKDSEALPLLRIIWGNIKIMPKNEIDDILRGPPALSIDNRKKQYSSRVLFVAASMGNTRFVVELIRTYPDLIWKVNDHSQSIFHIAVMHRHQGIYNLLYEIGSMKDLITPLKDENGNNMLHLVGKTSKDVRLHSVSGASLLMQRELLWFKEVEKMMPPSYRERKNKDGQTPYELFSDSNKDQVTQGLKWMKDCMVVATLIVTIAFAVAFTVPGGFNQENGIPIFIHERTFLVFVIADAISLFSSSTSLLVFLSVVTSRYGQRDFLYSLPRKVMIGLVTLFVSVAAMMVTFSASFFVLYRNGLKWVPILISVFATMPVIVYAALQLPLLVDMFRSMYDDRYLFKPRKRVLYNRNPR